MSLWFWKEIQTMSRKEYLANTLYKIILFIGQKGEFVKK